MSSTSSAIPTATATAPPSTLDAKGDFALFGKPSVVGAFNLTSGIIIYSAFIVLFVGAIGFATWQRAQYRSQFRQQHKNMESGRVTPGAGGDKAELSDADLFKQASISKRALMKDVGHGGIMAANETMKTKIADANGAGRSPEEREHQHQVRFGESNGNNPSAGGPGRTGGMKKTKNSPHGNGGTYEMNTYGHQLRDANYDNQDTTDYSRPPLQESTDPYYSSGSSHSGYLENADDYHFNPAAAAGSSPQVPMPSYNGASSSPQPQYQQPMFVQRTNSSRMPKTELHDGNNIFRSDSGGRGTPTRGLERDGSGSSGHYNSNNTIVTTGTSSRIATQGHLDRSGSGGNNYSRSDTPIGDANGSMSRTGSSASSSRTRVAPSPTLMHPTPIARSNSTRLPPSMRVGTPQLPSSLSQQTNNYDYM
ncbi:hypothetical protein BG011_006138 [Mortierella polycephala]|uniref:Uncharacterized protein n=1 Tax=Mortierella polycephala TaxID=41804 RepID=A0A9P6TZZ5_9FUNG|nr:hypothetical protein BG011_006138 [Mortierella polycephala]